MVEVDKRILGPQLLLQFLPRHQLPGPPQQQSQNLKRLAPELHTEPIFPKFMRIEIRFERTETHAVRI
jgi:hypothetical protein